MSKVYWIDKDSIAIADTENRIDFSGPTAGTLSLHCSRHDSPMVSAESGAKNSDGVRVETGMTESPVIPVEFHEALTYKAIAHGYEKKGELQTADYFHKKFNIAISEGKMEANSHKSDEASIQIIGTDF